MGTGSIKPCNMSKNLLQWGFSAAFPTLRKRVSRNAEEDLSCKGNISRIRQAGRSWLRQWAWVHFSTVLQNLCNFLLVPLVQVISQTNSLFSDTFNHQARIKVQKCKSAQEYSWKTGDQEVLSISEQRLALSAVQNLAESICTTATHSWPLWGWWVWLFYYYLFGFMFSPHQRQKTRLPQKTDVKNRCFLML